MKKKLALFLSVVMCMSVWIGDIDFVKAAEPTINKDTWTQVGDVWKKDVSPDNWDFESMPDGGYTPALKVGAGEDTGGKFYNDNLEEDKLFAIETVNAPNKVLKWQASTGPNNIISKVRFDKKYSYELKYLLPNTSGNIQLQNDASGADAIKVPINSEGGTIEFDNTIIPSGILLIKIWQGATGKITFDKLELIAVSPTNPDNPDMGLTAKEQLFSDNDVISPKGAGNFELDTLPEGDFIKTEGVTIVTEEKYRGNKSAKIASGKELVIKKESGLLANTEYTIYFAMKGNLSFRLSGFKNIEKVDYNNGNANGGDWEASELGKANMYNWLENLNISSANEWKIFRYDFTTGDKETNGVQARFTSSGDNTYVDTIFIAPKSTLEETTYIMPATNELSNGHRQLIDKGLQFQSWLTTDKLVPPQSNWMKVPPVEKVIDMGITAAQYNDRPNFNKTLQDQAKEKGSDLRWSTAFAPKYSHISSKVQDNSDGANTGSPTEAEWKAGFLTNENGLGYEESLMSMCIGDEENYSDTLTQNLKSWFEVAREKIGQDKVIMHHNEVGNTPQENMTQISTFNENMLRKYIRTAKPDLITYDMYYFRERRVAQTKGGTVNDFYNDLNRYRIVANEGYDGTGDQPIPWGQYHYSWRTGPGAATPSQRGDGWYEMTESQINLYSFATYAFGAKWMSNFRWLDQNQQYLFTDYAVDADGKTQEYYIYDIFKEMIKQSQNLGPHLTRILNKGIARVSGQNENGTNTPIDYNPDITTSEGQAIIQKAHISNVEVKNLGTQNGSRPGDVFISYSEPLNGLTEKDKEVFTSTDPKYFMILNGLTAGDGLPAEIQEGSSYETRQEIKVTFSNVPANTRLMKVSRVDGDGRTDTGKVKQINLDSNNSMTITIGGGYADLFYWEEGETKASTSKPAIEDGKEDAMVGAQKYVNTTPRTNLNGATLIVGNIKGTDDMAPSVDKAANINKPADKDLIDGNEIVLNTYATPGGNIGAIGIRYFSQDLWEFRIKNIQEKNNVTLNFREYEWTKEQLLENIKQAQAGNKPADMPDILVVPDSWLWDINGLISNKAVLSMNEPESVIEIDARKWNDAYTQMSTKDGKTYGAFTEPSLNPVGMFVNRTLIGNMVDLDTLHANNNWTFDELNKIIDANKSGTIKLFADDEYLIRQLLASAGVTDPYNFDAESEAYKTAMAMYQNLKDNNLLFEGTLEEQMEAFKAKQLMFIVAPYTDVAKHLSTEYWYYEDNATVRRTANYNGKWGEQTYTSTPDADFGENGKELWKVTVRKRPAGKYVMGANDWNFMLFPKATASDPYRAIVSNPSIPILPAVQTDENAEKIVTIYNQLAEEYKGLNNTNRLFKRGGEDYPDGRFGKDADAIRKAGLRDGFGDIFKATGVWDNVLKECIADNIDAPTTTQRVKDYLNNVLSLTIITDPEDTTELKNDAEVKVTLSAIEGAEIYYTLDETEPTNKAIKYTEPFTLKAEDVKGKIIRIKAIAIKDGVSSSIINKKIVFNEFGKEKNDLQRIIDEAKRILADTNSTAEQIVIAMNDLAQALGKFEAIQK